MSLTFGIIAQKRRHESKNQGKYRKPHSRGSKWHMGLGSVLLCLGEVWWQSRFRQKVLVLLLVINALLNPTGALLVILFHFLYGRPFKPVSLRITTRGYCLLYFPMSSLLTERWAYFMSLWAHCSLNGEFVNFFHLIMSELTSSLFNEIFKFVAAP